MEFCLAYQQLTKLAGVGSLAQLQEACRLQVEAALEQKILVRCFRHRLLVGLV